MPAESSGNVKILPAKIDYYLYEHMNNILIKQVKYPLIISIRL